MTKLKSLLSHGMGLMLAVACALALTACGKDGGPATDKNGYFKVVPPLPEGMAGLLLGQGVPAPLVGAGLQKFEEFRSHIRNGTHFALVDFTQHSKKPRMYVVDISTGQVESNVVAHGRGSDPNKDGRADLFSNIPDSRKSSLGAYLLSEKYYGKFGAAIRTDGLEATNSMVRRRNITMHPSHYVKEGKEKQGMSWGCFAVPYEVIGNLINKLRDGAFLYAYGKNTASVRVENARIEDLLANPAYRWVDEAEEAPLEGEW